MKFAQNMQHIKGEAKHLALVKKPDTVSRNSSFHRNILRWNSTLTPTGLEHVSVEFRTVSGFLDNVNNLSYVKV